MAVNRRISRTELNNILKDLPMPVQEHCRRCKQFASFLVDRVKTEDFFLDLKLNPTFIIDAVSYHDIGKTLIPKDALYLEHCNTAAKKKAYASHTELGITAVENALGVSFDEYTPKSFERFLYNAIKEHHESAVDGADISFVARITAIVDRFDNLMFVGKIGEPDFDGALSALRELSKTDVLDKRLTYIFTEDEALLRQFAEYVESYDKNKRKTDAYGMRLYYHPVYNVRDNKLDSYKVQTWLNDPYYGLVRPVTFMQVAELSGQIIKFEKVAFEKLCLELDKLFDGENEPPKVIFAFSPRQFEKKGFFKYVTDVVTRYEIDPDKIIISLNDAQMSEAEVDWVQTIQQFRKEGFRFMIR